MVENRNSVLVNARIACFLSILVTSGADLFIVRPEDTVVYQGDDTQLNCTFTEDLEDKAWFHEASRVASGESVKGSIDNYGLIIDGNVYNLQVYNTTTSTSGTYTCMSQQTTTKTSSADLYVIVDTPDCSVYPKSTVVEGHDIILRCTIDLAEETPGQLTWVKRGVESHRGEIKSKNTTWLTKIEKEDNGADFDCQFQHKTLPISRWSTVSCDTKIVLNVQYAPIVSVVTDDNYTILEGKSVAAHCSSIDANPAEIVEVNWKSPDGSIISKNESVLLKSLTRLDSGEYTCYMSNIFYNGEKGTGEASIAVDVQYMSSLSMTVIPTTNITEGKSVTFNCQAENGNPNPQRMVLSLREKVLTEKMGPNLHYTINGANGSDSGIYKCMAFTNFHDGSQNSSIMEQKLIVYYSPRIVSSKSSFEADIGDVVDMPCRANGYPTPTIKWYKGEDDVIPGDEKNRNITPDTGDEESVASTLTVTVADDSYYGIYICEASNDNLSTATQTMEIRKPAITGSFPVAIVSGSSAGVTVILICILVGIICYCKNRKNDSRGKECGGESNDGILMTARTTNRLEPEGLSHDINPYAESTAAPMRVTSSAEKIVTNEYELLSAPVTSGHGDATHLSGTQDVAVLYAVSSKQKTASDGNKDATKMVLYAMPDKTRTNRKAGELNYADLDLSGNQSGQRPQRITPVEKTVYADLRTTPAKMD